MYKKMNEPIPYKSIFYEDFETNYAYKYIKSPESSKDKLKNTFKANYISFHSNI